jgi:CheY-like chemotaxis protein
MSELEGKVALVVDDESAQVEFVSAILEDYKMKIMSASNGREAMERIEEIRPDVILLDLMMPEESGMKFFNKLKSMDVYKNIPVIMVSGSSQVTGVDIKSLIYDEQFAERKRKAFGTDSAPDAYLEKPVEPSKLVETIKGFLSR